MAINSIAVAAEFPFLLKLLASLLIYFYDYIYFIIFGLILEREEEGE